MIKQLSTLVFILLVFNIVQSRPLAPKKVVWSVDCGSKHSHRAEEGFIYEKDHGYDGDTYVIDYKTNPDYKDVVIYFSDQQHIYQSSRYGQSDITYFLPLEEETNYVIIMKFVEMYYRSKGKRRFHIKVGDTIIVENLDVLEKQQRFRIHEEYIDIKYSQKQILHKNKVCENAIVDNMVRLTFVKTDHEDPMIAALILYKGDLSQTDFFEKEMYREQWFAQYKQKVKSNLLQRSKQTGQNMTLKDFAQEVRIKHSKIGEIIQTYEQIESQPPQQEIPPLKDLLMTPLGIVLMIGFFASSFVLISYAFFPPEDMVKPQKQISMELPTTGISPEFQKQQDLGANQRKNEKRD